eukprot:m.225410 g.225410  ORF g.225410 m.225410 type:complete len:1315 (+) comp17041_c0_seq4:136-4080(+)
MTDAEREENIKVVLRVRPMVSSGANDNDTVVCLHPVNEKTVRLDSHKYDFTFDEVFNETASQDDVFQCVGKAVIDTCLEGYNGTIFAYGQTGSGKTFTMIGGKDENDDIIQHQRGIIPRAFEYLFSTIERENSKRGNTVKFSCSCSFTEIYNERIYDLLDPTCTGKNLREDVRNGVHIEDVTEHVVESPREALQVLNSGNSNRRTAETSMNRESSRSHAIFTMTIKSLETRSDGLRNVKIARLNLIDLAGSERQKDTQADGTRLREAGQINKSLSTLGNVITALVSAANGKQRHVPYRDSKLTFLLRDSLGGNTKTYLLAAVNPSRKAFGETLSTLKFAQRAKLIKNKAARNEDFVGNVRELQAEIKRLRELLVCQPQLTGPSLPAGLQFAEGQDDMKKLVCTIADLHRRSENEKEELADRLREHHELVNAYQKSLQALKMRYKFREAELVQLKRSAGAGGMQFSESEQIAALQEEVAALEQQLKVNVDAARLLAKNRTLTAELSSLRAQYPIDQDNVLLAQTRTRMLEMEEIVRGLLATDKDTRKLNALVSSANASPAALSPRARQQHDMRMIQMESELKQKIAELQAELEAQKEHSDKIQQNSEGKILELTAAKQAAEKALGELERALETERMKASVRLAQARDEQIQELSKAFADSDEIVDLAGLRQRMEMLVRDMKSSQLTCDELSAQIASLETTTRQLRQENDQLQSQSAMQKNAFEAKENDLNATIATLESRMQSLLTELQDKAVEAQAAADEIQGTKAALQHMQEMMDAESAAARSKLAELDAENTTQAGQLVSLRQELETALNRNQELLDERDTLESELQFSKEEQSRFAEELEEVRARMAELETEKDALTQTIAKQEQTLASYEQQLEAESDQQAQVVQLKHQIQQLQQEIEERAGAATETAQKMESLEKEAADVADKLKRKEAKFSEDRAQLLADLRAASEHVKELAATNASLSAELEECKIEEDRLNAELAFSVNKTEEFQRLLRQTEEVIAQSEEEYKDQMAEIMNAMAGLKEEMRATTKEKQILERQLVDAGKIVTAIQEKEAQTIAQLTADVERLKAQNLDLQQRLTAPKEGTSVLEEEKNALQQELTAIKAQEKRYLAMLDAAETSRVEKNAEISKLRAEVKELRGISSNVTDLREELEEVRAQNSKLENALTAAQRQGEACNDLQKQVEELKSQITIKEAYVRSLEKELKLQATQLGESLVDAQQLGEDLLGMKQNLDRAREENFSLRKEASQLKKENKALEEERNRLIGHQNHKQKLKEMLKIKEENNELRKLQDMSKELAYAKRRCEDQENVAMNV